MLWINVIVIVCLFQLWAAARWVSYKRTKTYAANRASRGMMRGLKSAGVKYSLPFSSRSTSQAVNTQIWSMFRESLTEMKDVIQASRATLELKPVYDLTMELNHRISFPGYEQMLDMAEAKWAVVLRPDCPAAEKQQFLGELELSVTLALAMIEVTTVPDEVYAQQGMTVLSREQYHSELSQLNQMYNAQ